MYGFVSHLVYLLYVVLRICCCGEKRRKLNASILTLLFVGINLMWLIQFWMLVFMRYSFPGRVCSGDYDKYMDPDDGKKYK